MAGSDNFTGQNIQDTYQRVLQISSSGQLADGTGSLVPLLHVTASYAVSASHEITYELSSSYAETASMASNNFNVQGDISASGDVIGQNFTAHDVLSTSFTGSVDNPAIRLGPLSGNAAGNKVGLMMEDLNPPNKLFVPYFCANGNKIFGFGTLMDMQAGIQMNSNKISFDADATNTFIQSDQETPENLEVHADGNIELRAQDDLQVYSNIDVSGQITASGHISASGNIDAVNIDALTSLQVNNKRITYANDDLTFLDTGLNVAGGAITASGDISSSGDIYGSTLTVAGPASFVGTVALTGTGRITGIDTVASVGDAANKAYVDDHVWNGNDITSGVVVSARLDTDTAHLSVNQVITGTKTINQRLFAAPGATDGNVCGDFLQFGTTTVVRGKIYYFDSTGQAGDCWTLTNATTAANSKGLLAVAMGNGTANFVGMCIKGRVNLSHNPGAIAAVLYLSEDTAGFATSTAPVDGDEVVRIIGYALTANGNDVWFDPDSTYVEIA